MSNDSLHNPFRNRFNYPVTWRLDEMQAHENVVWLRLRNHSNGESTFETAPSAATNRFSERTDSTQDSKMLSTAFSLSIVLIASVIVLFSAF